MVVEREQEQTSLGMWDQEGQGDTSQPLCRRDRTSSAIIETLMHCTLHLSPPVFGCNKCIWI